MRKHAPPSIKLNIMSTLLHGHTEQAQATRWIWKKLVQKRMKSPQNLEGHILQNKHFCHDLICHKEDKPQCRWKPGIVCLDNFWPHDQCFHIHSTLFSAPENISHGIYHQTVSDNVNFKPLLQQERAVLHLIRNLIKARLLLDLEDNINICWARHASGQS